MSKIYGHPLSPPSRTAMSVAKHLGVPFEYVFVDLITGAHQAEDYGKLNPNHKVPTFIEGDFVLTESFAIAKYLADRGEGSSLYPRDPKTRAQIDYHIAVLKPTTLRLSTRRSLKLRSTPLLSLTTKVSSRRSWESMTSCSLTPRESTCSSTT